MVISHERKMMKHLYCHLPMTNHPYSRCLVLQNFGTGSCDPWQSSRGFSQVLVCMAGSAEHCELTMLQM